MRVAMYARYSSENQRAASITDQFRNCERYAARDPAWRVTARYEDKAISGSKDGTGRPGYKAMLKAASEKQFDILLVDDLSRLSRDQVETEQVRRRFVFGGVRLIGVSDGIDTAAKGHKMLAGFKGIMNDVFLDDLRDKTTRGMTGQALKGYHCGGRAYGYSLVPHLDPTRLDPYGQPTRIGTNLVPHPEQAPVVRWIFERYADGWSPTKIVEDLNRRAVPPPGAAYRRLSPARGTWCASALRGDVTQGTGFLNNPLYAGQHIWGRARWETHPDTHKGTRRLRDRSEWIITEAPHLRLIDAALWARVKARQQEVHQASAAIRAALKLRSSTSTGRGPKYLFSSLLVCAQCQHTFIIVDPRHYGCGGWKYRGLSVCTNTIKVQRAVVESVLLEAIQRDLFTEEGFMVFQQEVTRLLQGRATTAAVPGRLVQVEREIANLLAAIRQGILTPTTKHALEQAEAECAALRRLPDPVRRLVPTNLRAHFAAMVAGLAQTTQIDRARAALRGMLGGPVRLHPCADGARRFLTAEVTGDYAGLLRLEQKNVVEGRGVEPLTPTLRTSCSPN